MVAIPKTIKLFINGEFPRSESGRSFEVLNIQSQKKFANVCQASRKDFRNAVESARAVQSGWAAKTSYNRGQILYRMAEMLSSRRSEFEGVICETIRNDKVYAKHEVDKSLEALIYYAGFADKFQQVLGSEDPVSSPHYNFTTVEPVGVVALCFSRNDLSDFFKALCPVIVSGNSVVGLLSQALSALLAPLGEMFQNSDLPGGVVNLLTGFSDELLPHMASHMEVQSLGVPPETDDIAQLRKQASQNMKRVVFLTSELSLQPIAQFVEYKTIWHPIGV